MTDKTSLRNGLALFLMALLSTLSAAAQQPAAGFVPVTDAMLQNPDPADWLMWRRTLNSWGYSPLEPDQSRATSRGLRMVWTRGMGPGIQEGTPLVYGRRHVSAESERPTSRRSMPPPATCIWEYKRKLPDDV